MAIQFTLAFVVSSLCLMAALESVVQTKRVADSAQADRLAADVHFVARAKRHAPPSRAFLIAPPSARNMEADGAVPRFGPGPDEFSLQGREYENEEANAVTNEATPEAASEATSEAAPTTAAPEGSDEAISPLIVYAIVASLVLMTVAMLVVAIAVVYIVCTIPVCDKDDEEDPCAAPKGKPSDSARRRPASAPLSRCPSFSRHSAGDRRYTQQSAVDLGRQSSRGSSLGRQSSCRICPRFAPKSSRARASCASTGTCSSGASDGPVAPGAAPAPSASDYFVSCVCDLPTPREYSPSVSAASTFGRC